MKEKLALSLPKGFTLIRTFANAKNLDNALSHALLRTGKDAKNLVNVKHKFGFTLIELLIVISIIGILVTFVAASYTGAQKQARDSQRRSDLNQYKIAIENYAASNNYKYPGYNAASSERYTPFPIRDGGSGNLCRPLPDGLNISLITFINSCIFDPKNPANAASCDSTTYTYCYGQDSSLSTYGAYATAYYLTAKLETGGYWILCSNGKSGKYTGTFPPAATTCPLP